RDVPGVGVEEVRAMLAEGRPLQLIDTRPKHFVSRQQDIAEGVTWRDPERVGEWMGEPSKEKPVVVYCAYGFHVGCKTAIALRDAGFDAKDMKGGHSAGKGIGGRLDLSPQAGAARSARSPRDRSRRPAQHPEGSAADRVGGDRKLEREAV